MTPKTMHIAAVLSAALALAACSSRRPAQLPPAPPTGSDTGAEAGTAAEDGGVAGAAIPGTQAHFRQSVPSDRVFFDTDSYTLTAEGRAVLDAQAAYLEQFPNVTVTIEGHCDERGTREYNLALGDRRANSVRNYLESRGVAASRMTTISWGKERPEVIASSEEAWAQNRRSVTVLPN